ncbi:acyl-CoA dehydrogenase family protein [Alkalihalobacillus sp. BA299]|uniref:acyl-CoA dehydrogenase family protein n=1 Tax=Alkalihalobacillus sp. BA299 TaxID=2815938 RepID=UPI001AD9D49A|nr:acyl-CoA dehydrogenase family protein [Alkalihalobacillus sp. BA299]
MSFTKEMVDEGVMKVPEWWLCPPGLEEFRKKAHQVGRDVLLIHSMTVDEQKMFPKESLKAMAEAGFGALPLPKEYGGLGAGYKGFAVAAETFAQYCASATMVWVMHTVAVQAMFTIGTEEQRNRFIPGVLKGDIGALAFSEPATGSHFWNVVSEAPKLDGGYLLDAHKSWVTSGGEADWYIVCTNYPDPTPDKGDTLMFVIVPKDAEGIESFPFSAMGLRGNSSGPMKFNHIFIPTENRLGTEGGMNQYNDQIIDPLFLLGTSGCWIGVAQGALNEAIEGAKMKVHKDTGKSVSGYQVIRHEIAKAQIIIDSARSMLFRVAEAMDKAISEGKTLDECLYTLWQLKTYAADIVIQVTNMALQISGGRGYLTGRIEKFVRDGRAGALMGPTNEILREWIGKSLIGVPWFETWDYRQAK